METENITAEIIKNKGRHIKSLREKGLLIAQLFEYKKIQYVVHPKGSFWTRDEDNENGITAALFPYKFNSQSLFRAIRKGQAARKARKINPQ